MKCKLLELNANPVHSPVHRKSPGAGDKERLWRNGWSPKTRQQATAREPPNEYKLDPNSHPVNYIVTVTLQWWINGIKTNTRTHRLSPWQIDLPAQPDGTNWGSGQVLLVLFLKRAAGRIPAWITCPPHSTAQPHPQRFAAVSQTLWNFASSSVSFQGGRP